MPSSTSDMTATAMMGLVSEAIRKMASRASGAALAEDGVPNVSTCTSSPLATRVTSAGRRSGATWAAIASRSRTRPSPDSWLAVSFSLPVRVMQG